MKLTSPRMYSSPPPVPKMPIGLVDLMEGLTKEVLRNNPTELYVFCANHMEKLLEIRDGKPMRKILTLDEKIKIAQEKVKDRAKMREELYDSMFKEITEKMNLKPDNVACNEAENEATEVNMSLLKAPVHHDLVQTSEVEISHETPNKTEYKIINTHDLIKIEISEPMDSLPFEVNESQNEAKDNMSPIDEKSCEDIETSCNITPNNKSDFELEIVQNVDTEITSSLAQNDDSHKENMGNEDIISSSANTNEESVENNSETTDINAVVEVVEEKAIQEDVPDKNDVKTPDNLNDNEVIESNESAVTKTDDIKSIVTSDDTKTELNDTSVSKNDESECSNEVTVTDVPVSETNKPVDDNPEINSTDDKEQNIEKAGTESEVLDTDTQTKSNIDVNETTPPINETENKLENIISDENKEKISIESKTEVIEDQNVETTDTTVKPNLTEQMLDTSNTTEVEIVSNTENKDNNTKIKNESENINETNSTEPKDDPQVNDHNKEVINNTESDDSTKLKKDLEQDNTESTNKSENTDNFDDSSLIDSDFSKTEDDISRNENNGQNNMDLETAAVTIQKVFRTFLFKSRNSTFDDTNNDEGSTSLDEDDKKEEYYAAANLSKERRPLGITRMDTVLQTVNEEKSLSLSTDDSSTLSSAATTIQAHVRGFLVRNRLNSNRTISTNSLVNSNEAVEAEVEHKNKTILNIHIVPEEGNYLSRDESIITSMDLSLDACSPPSSVNLHPMSCDISERRKLLKREDAVQSVSPPSNNSGKLSEESVKDVFINDNDATLLSDVKEDEPADKLDQCSDSGMESEIVSTDSTVTATTVLKNNDFNDTGLSDSEVSDSNQKKSFIVLSSDESDVITPYAPSPRSMVSMDESEKPSKLMHSGECHDVVLPTKVTRSDTTVVSEFHDVMVYFLLWNRSYE